MRFTFRPQIPYLYKQAVENNRAKIMKSPLSRQRALRGMLSALLCLASLMFCLAGIAAQTSTMPSPPSQLHTRGLWVQIEERGWPNGYWPGQVIRQFNDYDPVVGHTVSEEVALQMDAMRGMGVNTITIELRTAVHSPEEVEAKLREARARAPQLGGKVPPQVDTCSESSLGSIRAETDH